jgi:ribonuclease P protein component
MLPKKNRTDKKLVEKIFKQGVFVGSLGLTLKYCLEGGAASPRVSFIVPKKVANKAVRRNYLRRRGYLVLEKYFNRLPNGFSGVFIFNKIISTLEIENEIKKIFNKIN